MDDADRYRCRRIYIRQSDELAFQAEAACDALNNIDGILLAAPFDTHCIHIIYSLDQLSYEIIVELLAELKFETDKSMLQALRNTIFCDALVNIEGTLLAAPLVRHCIHIYTK